MAATPTSDAAERRALLIRYALWISPVWEAGNSDDEDSAAEAVDAFLKTERKRGR